LLTYDLARLRASAEPPPVAPGPGLRLLVSTVLDRPRRLPLSAESVESLLAALPPALDLAVDVTGLGDHRRPALKLHPGATHPSVEVLDDAAYLGLHRLRVEPVVEPGVLGA